MTSRPCYVCVVPTGTPMGGLPGAPPPGATDDFANDLLPAAGLVTSSEDYYPTVAINALMRVLRDSGLSSQHQAVISSLMQIFKALGTASVPYLPKVGFKLICSPCMIMTSHLQPSEPFSDATCV